MISARFIKFCCIGGLGFVIDTGTLLCLVRVGGMTPLLAKVLSFAVAVVLTFEGNRRWAFGAEARGLWLPTFLTYLGVQATGFALNWLVFGLCLGLLPPGDYMLVAAGAFASVVALFVNFLGAKRLVFTANGFRKT